MSQTADTTTCTKCGGSFGAKRIIIDDKPYHERCSIMSHPSHTWEDYARLSDLLARNIQEIEWAHAALDKWNINRADFVGGRPWGLSDRIDMLVEDLVELRTDTAPPSPIEIAGSEKP